MEVKQIIQKMMTQTGKIGNQWGTLLLREIERIIRKYHEKFKKLDFNKMYKFLESLKLLIAKLTQAEIKRLNRLITNKYLSN